MKTLLFATIITLAMSFTKHSPAKPLRYIALGDSYTICTGTAKAGESWPSLLAKNLTATGMPTELLANPSANGFSTQDLIDRELPVLDAKGADFVTLLIGVNDWVRQVDAATFHRNLNSIIEHIEKKLSNKKHLVLITIPDFGVTPQGSQYGHGRDIAKGLTEFNDIIKAEALQRGLACVDIFPVSKLMKDDPALVAADGLHPSAKEYALWEALIFPQVKKVLSE
jgi:lysophospholipase L1-like esterase